MNSIFRDENKNGLNPVEEKNPVYRAIKKIGQGSFGKAYLVESEHDHKRYIMKVFVLFKQIENPYRFSVKGICVSVSQTDASSQPFVHHPIRGEFHRGKMRMSGNGLCREWGHVKILGKA